MIRLLSALMAWASAACVRTGCSASAISTMYPHIERSYARSTGSSRAVKRPGQGHEHRGEIFPVVGERAHRAGMITGLR